MRIVLVTALIGCSSPSTTATLSNNTARPAGPTMKEMKGLEYHRPDKSERDCRLSTVLRAKWGHEVVTSCGAMDGGFQTGMDCVMREQAAGRGFVLEGKVQGTDSAVGRAFVGVIEKGTLVTYAGYYDDDPCGGDCSERGGTKLLRCKRIEVAKDCPANREVCLDCIDSVEVEHCTFGAHI